MTVYEEVAKELKDCAPMFKSDIPDTIKMHIDVVLGGKHVCREQWRYRYMRIAVNAIAAIKALDAEKGKEAGNGD